MENIDKKMQRVHILITGQVQGVFFRQNMQEAARAFKVNGWVRNNSQGGVEALLEARQDKIEQMIKWCEKGPILAQVDSLNIKKQDYIGEFDSFQIKN